MKRELRIDIDSGGQVAPDVEAAKALAAAAGAWQLVPHVGEMMVLVRENRVSTDRRLIRLAGAFEDTMVVPSILNLIHMARWDGALTVSGDGHERVLFLRSGVYLSGTSTNVSHRLGAILVARGLLSAAVCEHVVEQHRSSPERLGRALVKAGRLSTSQVYDALRAQAEDIFLSAVRVARGTFHLVAPLDMAAVPAMLRLDVAGLLLDSMRRIDEEAKAPAELSRPHPVDERDLTFEAAAQIVDTYSEALRRLFAALPPEAQASLRQELLTYLRDSLPYRALFENVTMSEDGTVDTMALMANVSALHADRPLTMIQLGLSEMLFFGMFSAGDALSTEDERALQREVAEALRELPG